MASYAMLHNDIHWFQWVSLCGIVYQIYIDKYHTMYIIPYPIYRQSDGYIKEL